MSKYIKKINPKNKGGRPTLYNIDMCTEICTRLSQGQSLRSICRAEDMPDIHTVIRWRIEKPEFSTQYAQAREDQADTLADEIQDIADDGTNDYMTKTLKNGDSVEVVDKEHIQRSRLRVDTRKWIASKLKSKSYGDKVNVDHSGTIKSEVSLTKLLNDVESNNRTEKDTD